MSSRCLSLTETWLTEMFSIAGLSVTEDFLVGLSTGIEDHNLGHGPFGLGRSEYALNLGRSPKRLSTGV
eukprot:6197975-Prorocentrum_lima.AAC.1